MALQDTTSKMGATTICPGTHWCANENLEDICLPGSDEAPHAFEASSNGETGRETGMLYQGDGMMFNQNIWHRGPRNDDPERPINRVMFILTFVSRQDHSKGDVRQQGLGTYYYQRWNMWGHTFEDLKRARKVMTQPVAALRAMGVWKLPDTKWGISWFEHFARQLANNEDFFADYELPDFLNFLDSVPIPRWLRGQQRKMIEKIVLRDEDLQWESFLKQLSTNIARFVDSIHLIAVGAYATIHILSIVITRHGTSSFVKRTLFKYIVVGLLWFSLWYYVTKESYIGKRIHLREAWRQPVSNYSSLEHLELTTLPTRYDVLIGSRFDTPYLASFNHLLDYHPGNKELIKAVSAFESHELVLAFMSQPRQGVTPRFLKQDWQTGYWSLVSPRETVDYIRRQLYVKHNPLIARLDEFIKITLASSRFGPRREKAISRRFTTQLVIDLQTKLYRVIDSCVNMSQNAPVTTKSAKQKEMHVQYFSVIKRPIRSTLSLKTPTTLLFRNSNGSLRFVRQGDRILAPLFEIGEYAEATLVQVISRELVQVKYAFNDELDMVPIIGIRPYRSFVQGDKVEILDGREGKWLSGKILMMHPMAHASILYIDGTGAKKIVDKVPLDMIRFVDKAPQTLEVLITIIKYAKGDRIRAKFQGNAWFLGVVDQLNDDGTFGILYDDGDHEPKVPIEFLTAVTVKKDTTGASPTNDSPLSPSSAMLKNGQQIYPVVPQQIR